VVLFTEHYRSSEFCLCELGAAWGLDKSIIPLMAPSFAGAAPSSLPRELQAILLNNEVALDSVCGPLKDTNFSVPVWNAAKRRFLLHVENQPSEPIIPPSPGRPPEAKPRVYPTSQSSEFHAAIEVKLRKAEKIVMIGTGLAILKQRPLLENLKARATRGECSVEIFLGDRASPAVEARMAEEELLDRRVGVPAGVRPEEIYEDLRSVGPKLKLYLFTHYPTFALIIADGEYFTYPYGYATLGNFSPVHRYSREAACDAPFIEFLQKQYELIKDAALEAAPTFHIRRSPQRLSASERENLVPLAVYYIPPADSDFYRFGTKVLGFDIHSGEPCKSMLPAEMAGAAQPFGFHLTICDALFFANQAEFKNAAAQTAVLARQFKSFSLSKLKVKEKTPDQHSIAITVEDHTGSLEAIHCELVHRVYRRASASNYSLGLSQATRDQEVDRAKLMIRRYKAPYILLSYRPHFTLASNVDAASISSQAANLHKMLATYVPTFSVKVEELCIVTKNKESWSIVEKIPLVSAD